MSMKVTTFGEALFRLSTAKGERLTHAQRLDFFMGGTELNIAANLQSLGVSSHWVSSLPDGLTGDLIRQRVAQLGVTMDDCQTISQGRAGWYLLESGGAPRPDVVYHRSASSMAEEQSFNFNWPRILAGSQLFHTSGVACGLSNVLTSEVKKAMTQARASQALVSYDFNYRKNIWSIDEFTSRQKELLPLIDILFCSESDLELFFKKDPTSTDYTLVFDNSAVKYLVINQRSADESEYAIKLVTRTKSFDSKKYKITNLDRIGVGDSMAAGFMAGLLKTQDDETACQWGALAGAMKYGISGDMALIKEKELTDLLIFGPKGIIR